MSNRDELLEHLRFARELGVLGSSRDPVWRWRETGAAPAEPLALSGCYVPVADRRRNAMNSAGSRVRPLKVPRTLPLASTTA